MAGLDESQFNRLENAEKYFASRNAEKTGDDQTSHGEFACQSAALDVEKLWHQQEWLHQQLIEHKGALNAAKDSKPASSEDLENLQLRANDLQKELLEAQTDSSLQDLMLQRHQLSSTLSKTLFPPGGYGEEMPEQEQIRKCMTELLEKQTELGSAIMRIQKEIQDLTPELEETKEKNLDLLKTNRELMYNLQQMKNAADRTPKKINKMKELQVVYDKTLSKIKMARHVFQALILGSGVNWAADESMMEQMISLGLPLEKQLEQS